MQRDIINLQEERVKLMERLQTTEKQVELLKMQIEQEKARYSELELVLSKERNVQHEQHLQIQNIEKEKGELKTEIINLNAKISSIHCNDNNLGMESQMNTLQEMATPQKK